MNLDRGGLLYEAGSRALFDNLAAVLDVPVVETERRRFPDGESYVRVTSNVPSGPVLIVASLDDPDPKFLPLVYLARLLRELGAGNVVLVAPYLAYMRQDRRFREGEALTSRVFADLIGRECDGLVTVEPHLHRYGSLDELYSVPAREVHAARALADWIADHVASPLLVGPDAESRQWVRRVARRIDAPFTVLRKERRGDRDVEVHLEDSAGHTDRTPVLLDDIISTARTMIEAVGALRDRGYPPAVCVGVHGIFTGDALDELRAVNPRAIVTTNAVEHSTNGIDLSGVLAAALRECLGGWGRESGAETQSPPEGA